MALIPYKAAGDSLTADEWNTIFAAADAILTNYLGGLSPLFFGEKGDPRKFFFFNPVVPPTTGLHPLAASWLAQAANPNTGIVGFGYWRQYNHGAITSLVDGLAVATGTPAATNAAFKVTRLAAPTTAAWHAAIFPENGYGTNDAYYYGSINLDICLSILTRAGNTITLGVATAVPSGSANGFTNTGEVEIVHNYDAIELIVIGSQAFDASWNKYNAFRVHNLGNAAATVSFPGGSVTVPPGGCGCIRRVGSTYTVGYNYFQKMVSGDPRFWALSQNTSNQLCPFNAAALIATIGLFTNLNASRYWEMSALYTTLLAPPQASSVIFDLLCGFGAVSARSAIGVTVVAGGSGYSQGAYAQCVGGAGIGTYQAYLFLTTDGAGKVISASIANVGNYTTLPTNPVGVTFVAGTGALFNLTFPPPLSFTGWSNLAAMFALAGYTWSYNSTTKKATITSPTNGQILVDLGSNLVKMLTATSNPPVHSISFGTNYVADLSIASGFSRRNRLIATIADTDYGGGVVVHNAGAAYDPTDTWALQNISYTIADTVQKLIDCINAMVCALISVQNVQILLTPFGPVLYWEESYPINKNFDPAQLGISGVIVAPPVSVVGTNVIIYRTFLLVGSFQNFFLPITPPLSQIHFPRKGRVYQAKRAVVHTGANEPWQTNTGAYTTYEPPQLKRFFESQPLGTEAPLAAAQAQPVLIRPDGASYLGPLDGSTVPANAAESLLCSVEHYNALASQINGVPVTPAKKSLAPLGNGNCTLDFSTLFIVNGGTGYTVGPNAFTLLHNTFYITVTSVGPNGEITGIVPPTVNNIITINAQYPPSRPFPASYGTGQGATFDVASGSYAGCSFIPGYAPGGVPVPVDGQNQPTVGVAHGNTHTFFPRNCFYSWWGATPGGADPVSDYFASIGVPIQTAVPDGYGTPIPIYQYVEQSDGSVVQQLRDYAQGFTPAFQAQVQTWRWITIDDARTLYAKFNIPFVLSATNVPLKFLTQIVTDGAPTTSDHVHDALWGMGFDYDPSNPYIGPPHTVTPNPVPPANFGGGGLGDVSQILVIFLADSNGNWACGFEGQALTNNASLSSPVWPYDLSPGSTSQTAYHNFSYLFNASYAGGDFPVFHVTDTTTTYDPTFALPGGFLPVGTPLLSNHLQVVSILAEGVASICAVVLPRNFAYYSGGTLVADNSQEAAAPQVILIDGSGALGPETLITCAAANANLITFPINNTFAAGMAVPAA
jgi:hypothetical protein